MPIYREKNIKTWIFKYEAYLQGTSYIPYLYDIFTIRNIVYLMALTFCINMDTLLQIVSRDLKKRFK